METDFRAIYRHRAEDYDRLVSAEDADGRLLPALDAIAPIAGSTFVDVGAGTGRISRLLLSAGAREVFGFDESAAMLAVAERTLAREPPGRWHLGVADASSLPLQTGSVDHAVAGWVFGHLRSWAPDWRETIGGALAEMARVVRPGGARVIIETLGTGNEDPLAPTPELAEYYEWLETTHGMQRTWLRTDYAFADPPTAVQLTEFFFGATLADRIRANGRARVPECTGIWWRR